MGFIFARIAVVIVFCSQLAFANTEMILVVLDNCVYCKAFEPIVEEFAAEKKIFLKKIDYYQAIAQGIEIGGLPSLFVLYNGNLFLFTEGYYKKSSLYALYDQSFHDK